MTPDDVALTGGTWVPRGGVLVWAAGPPPAIPIACPVCNATIYQTCRTAGGHRTKDHPTRVLPRVCPCGGELEYRKILCANCRIDAQREVTRVSRRREAEAKWAA